MVKIKVICTNGEEKGRVKSIAAQEWAELRLFVKMGRKRAELRVLSSKWSKLRVFVQMGRKRAELRVLQLKNRKI